MSGAPAPDAGAIAFAEKVFTMLAEGRFTATYKYSVLLGLMDLCLEYSTRTGAAPESVTTSQLANKILELYWPHTAPFGEGGGSILLQNAGKQAGILSAILRFRSTQASDPSTSLARARAQSPEAIARLCREVEWKLVEMPLPRLQTIGQGQYAFLYEIRWDVGIRRAQFNDSMNFDNLIRFVEQAGDHLIRLSGLLRPLIQREWTRLVSRLNAQIVPELSLERFLFGLDRISTDPIRVPLRELANGRCFYCAGIIDNKLQIDHFIPWVRHANNGIENLVVAHSGCNGSKSDHLAAPAHVERWVERAVRGAADLATVASGAQWENHPSRSLGVARSIYLRLPDDLRLWQSKGEFVPTDRTRLEGAFAGSRGAPI